MEGKNRLERIKKVAGELTVCFENMGSSVRVIRDSCINIGIVENKLKAAISKGDIQEMEKIIADLGSSDDGNPDLGYKPLSRIILDLLEKADVYGIANELIDIRNGILPIL